ncbi:hypothetical protein [Helicobacter marmotae]|nr:hypothetical protein [Helicobacter marmotae]
MIPLEILRSHFVLPQNDKVTESLVNQGEILRLKAQNDNRIGIV